MIFILIITLLLRLPSLFEPYWYGDEGIYLAIGQAIQRGAVLYRDIWDNKPPLLYMIYAIIPTLLWAKVTATVFVLGTTAIVYKTAKNYLAALLAGVLLSLPLLEGTIANAELYFILPIALAALYFLRDKVKPVIIGILFTLAFLLKIPAVFDFLGLFLAYFLIQRKIRPFILIFLTFAVSFFFFLSYFFFNHALADFLTASFSQNASYVAVGTGPLSKLSNPLFTKGFLLIFSCAILWILYLKKRISRELLFLTFWFSFSLYGTLLSNRPYMHYLLQIVPPGTILLFYLLSNIRKYSHVLIAFLFIIFALIRMFKGAFALDSRSYYLNWFDYVSERKLWRDYVNYFDSRTSTNYELSNYLALNTVPNDPLFVWGDNAFIYVLANRPPATKFIQAHHLTTIDPSNYIKVADRLNKTNPKFILVSRPAHFSFPALEELIAKNYRQVKAYQDWYVYKFVGLL